MFKHLLLVFLEAYESHFVDSSKIIDELETSYLKNVTQVTKNKAAYPYVHFWSRRTDQLLEKHS